MKTIQVVSQTAQLVTAAQTNLRSLAGGGTNISGVQARIANVTGLLQQAQATCTAAMTGKTLPSACMVRSNVANAQAAQLGASMASIQGLQAAAAGSPGSLAVGQAQAQATVEVATQLQQIHQMQLGEAQQKQIDGQAILNAAKPQ
jgi:hypothetical protein